VDPMAGIVFKVRSGARVQRGDAVAVVTSSDAERCRAAADLLRTLIQTTTAPVEPEPSVVLDVW
jgi:thymidine phosphorylase